MCAVHSSREGCLATQVFYGFMVYAVDRKLANSSIRAAVVAVTVKSSMLMATNVAAFRVILRNGYVSASDFLKPWPLRILKTA